MSPWCAADVLVNNAGSFQAGFFEEMTPEAFRSQVETTLLGPVYVTRATLRRVAVGDDVATCRSCARNVLGWS